MFNITCDHNLGWPRKAVTGETYRVCSKCTREYEVDPVLYQPLGKRAAKFSPAPAKPTMRVICAA
jgi:hypothetical protein